MIKKLFVAAILMVFMFGVVLAEDIEGGFMHDGTHRTYLLHIPPLYNGEDSIPLVINLHGGGGTAGQQATVTQMNAKADSDTFLVVYPNGTILPTTGYTGWNAGECWGTNVDDVGFISALIDTVVANYNVDTLRIYTTGFSLGGMMTHRLTCELAEKIAATAPIAGGLFLNDWNDCQPKRLIPIMYFHARDDPNAPYDGGRWFKDCYWTPVDSFMEHWAVKLGCDIGPDTFYNDSGALRQRWSRTDDSCEVILWTTEDGEHSWPGSFLGSKAISANDEMWEFFMAHPIPVEEPGIQEPSSAPFFSLDPASPTIFTQSAVIHFSLDQSQHVTLKLFDILGREIVTLLDRPLGSGQHEVVIDTGGLSAGVYFYRLITPTLTQTRSITVIK